MTAGCDDPGRRGTSFRFSAMRGNQSVTETVTLPSNGDNLERCLANLVEGFTQVKSQCPRRRGHQLRLSRPADYPNGIIGDLGNLPCFAGVALGRCSKRSLAFRCSSQRWDLFVYGEAIAGFCPM